MYIVLNWISFALSISFYHEAKLYQRESPFTNLPGGRALSVIWSCFERIIFLPTAPSEQEGAVPLVPL
jgi:hypothetical protein